VKDVAMSTVSQATHDGGHEPCGAGDSQWISRQVDALAAAWEQGERVTVDDLLTSHPELRAEAAIRLIYEEVCLRRDAGQEVGTAEVVCRFPQWKEELEVLLGCDRMLRPLASSPTFPAVGTPLGPFHLLAELGRGASGRTYLASEPGLADRLVVLKVISDDQEEHLRLARLQHTHIVPLYFEQTLPDRGLRALCMPYLGGASLAQILSALSEIPLDRRRGRDLIEGLERVQLQRSAPAPSASNGPCRRYLEGASYVEAVCWIGTCLAEALQHAHARGLLHMDITPANVLIAGDGQPMLLDFHLARGPVESGKWVLGRLGGTPGCMSPEQEAALDAVRAGRPIPEPVDGRSDIHALGLLLRETLWGTGRKGETETGLLRQDRAPGVSVGLADIIDKCLAPKPSARYHDAAALAGDLRLHLNNLPLRGVANRSPIERWRKWQRRQGSLARQATRLTALAGIAVALALAGAVYSQRVHEIEANLEDGRRSCSEQKYSDAIRILGRGLERAAAVPGAGHLRRDLAAQLDLAQRGQDAVELHRLADLIRFRYGLALPDQEEALMTARHCRALWDAKHRLAGPGGGRLDDETERGIKTDLLELAIVWANLNVRLAPRATARLAQQASLRLLDQAEALFGPSPALDREREAHARAPGQALAPAPVTAASTAWEHYDLGRFYLRSGQVAAAAEEFRCTLERQPQDFWPNFYQGLCAYRLGNYEDACAAFRTCIALAPKAAECYYNRALAHQALGRSDQAVSDYGRALEIDPGLTAAALNRGLLRYTAGRHRDAIADFHRALRANLGRKAVGQIHYNLALAYLAAGDRDSAVASSERALNLGYGDARGLCDRLHRGL
jgi:serine/threonine protein kinase/Tfp pilus assembly protein PilF